ncbi:MAG TPA: ArsR family transcriptional regulator [Porticoccaceae bacterium]|nr:ArsR family transcriptional regulator [Porticoccaceae bacterium]
MKAQTSSAAPAIAMDKAVSVLKAAGDSQRALILRILSHDAFGVLELSRIFDVRQPAMSHHLKILSQAGLVIYRREGTCIFYRRGFYEQDGFDQLRQQIFAQLDKSPVPAEIEARIEAVHSERAETSRVFFRENAERFREQQDLIASYVQYGDTVLTMIDDLNLPASGHALEIGPGEGQLLPELAARFQSVTALDNSAEMLAASERFAAGKGSGNIRFVCEDIADGQQKIRASLVTANMVLHHLARPGDVIRRIYGMLGDSGALVVTELCQHDQDWAHSACGDLWLGFCPEELASWATGAGFVEGKSQYLAQRNGFRIQLRQFLKTSG